MSVSLTKRFMQDMIAEYTQKQLDAVFDEELAKAAERVKERQAEIVSKVALKIAHNYRIESRENEIVIIVKDERK